MEIIKAACRDERVASSPGPSVIREYLGEPVRRWDRPMTAPSPSSLKFRGCRTCVTLHFHTRPEKGSSCKISELKQLVQTGCLQLFRPIGSAQSELDRSGYGSSCSSPPNSFYYATNAPSYWTLQPFKENIHQIDSSILLFFFKANFYTILFGRHKTRHLLRQFDTIQIN